MILFSVDPLRSIILSILASLGLMAVPAMAQAQVTNAIPSKPDAASLQKKAIESLEYFTK